MAPRAEQHRSQTQVLVLGTKDPLDIQVGSRNRAKGSAILRDGKVRVSDVMPAPWPLGSSHSRTCAVSSC